MSQDDWQPVLSFWFGREGFGREGFGRDELGDERDDVATGKAMAGLWWGKSTATDQLIRERFGVLLNELTAGNHKGWLSSAQGRLAAILVVDQFSRNIYRDDARAFRADHLALQWCLDGINCGDDLSLRPIERVFFYLPLEHAESTQMQQLSLLNYQGLLAAVPSAQKQAFSGYLDFAKQHAAVIEQFGRYPHRNTVLGRESTAEEIEYLRQPGSGF